MHETYSKPTKRIALITTFAVLGVICDIIVVPVFSAGVWYGWIFVISPLAGIVLGSYDGFLAVLLAVMIGHSVIPRETVYEFIFTLGAPLGAMISGFTYRGRLRRVFLYYTVMIVSYFATPVSRLLPLWGMWNCYVAYATVIILVVLKESKVLNLEKIKQRYIFAFSAFLGLEADVLFRIFVFVPCQTYRLFYGLTPEALALLWAISAPIITPIKVAVSTLITAVVCQPLIRILRDKGWISD